MSIAAQEQKLLRIIFPTFMSQIPKKNPGGRCVIDTLIIIKWCLTLAPHHKREMQFSENCGLQFDESSQSSVGTDIESWATSKCLDIFESYLTNRKICTVIDGAKSQFLDVEAGVPQGSRLGPLLWILYNQDIIDDLESECLLYADDTCLFAFGKDPVKTIEKLNRDLVKIGLWAEHTKKSKDMIFMKSKIWSNMSPPLILNGAPISRVHQHKHLGLWLTPSSDWGKQAQQTGLRANGKLAVLQSCKFLERSTLDMLYKITIRSVLEYGLVVYFHS